MAKQNKIDHYYATIHFMSNNKRLMRILQKRKHTSGKMAQDADLHIILNNTHKRNDKE